jgi:hypothetical protein
MIINMNRPLKLLLLVIITITSFALGWTLKPDQNLSKRPILEKEVVQKIIVDRPREAIEDDLKRREIAAREYYEKAFSLFLASLGLKLSLQQNESLDDLIRDPKAYIENAPLIDSKSNVKVSKKEDSGIFLTYREKSYEDETYRFLPEDLKDKLKRDNLAAPLTYLYEVQIYRRPQKAKEVLGRV